MEEDSDIVISKSKLFKLVREMKEYRKLFASSCKNTKADLIFKHNLKVQTDLLDGILSDGGIDKFMNKITSKKEHLLLVEGIEKNE